MKTSKIAYCTKLIPRDEVLLILENVPEKPSQ